MRNSKQFFSSLLRTRFKSFASGCKTLNPFSRTNHRPTLTTACVTWLTASELLWLDLCCRAHWKKTTLVGFREFKAKCSVLFSSKPGMRQFRPRKSAKLNRFFFKINSVENYLQLNLKTQSVKVQRQLKPDSYFLEFFNRGLWTRHLPVSTKCLATNPNMLLCYPSRFLYVKSIQYFKR